MGKNHGKNKHKKINDVFKVAGAKSLKLKAKAKAVKGDLKRINAKTKEKIEELSKQFTNIQSTVVNKIEEPKMKTEPSTIRSKLPLEVSTKSSQENDKRAQEAFEDLEAMQL